MNHDLYQSEVGLMKWVDMCFHVDHQFLIVCCAPCGIILFQQIIRQENEFHSNE